MSESMPSGGRPPEMDLYTRNGFAGPATMMIRTSYTPAFTRVEGDYVPRRLEAWQSVEVEGGARALPVTVLESPTVRLDLWQRSRDMPFALKDVYRDQVLYVQEGHARLETDFGVLDLAPLDMVRIPRSVGLRLVDVKELRLFIVASVNPLNVDPENDAVLSPALVDTPRGYENPMGAPGEHELVVRHGEHMTSYFFDYDPLAIIESVGAPVVQRFNLANVNPLVVKGVAAPPAQLISDPTTETMFYYMGAREGGRPPVHHNADYDEIAIYGQGPGAFGALSVPGLTVWVPKGVIHQGPEEYVPEGFVGWLFETRANLVLTEAGRRIAHLMETTAFDVHPSEAAAAEPVPVG